MTTSSSFQTSGKNPFSFVTPAAKNPFATEIEAVVAGPVGYAPVASGPAVDPAEVENAAVAALEVQIAWGTTVLSVAHLTPPRAYSVGAEGCDFTVPAEKLGAEKASLVEVEGGRAFVVLPASARGWIELPGQGRMSLDELRGSSLVTASASGESRVALPAAARLRMELGDVSVSFASVAAGRKIRRALFGASLSALLFAGLSLVGHASILGGMAFFRPSLDGIDGDESRRENEVMMQQFLKAAAEKETEQQKLDDAAAATDGGASEGARAKAPEGAMGSTVAKVTGGKFAVKGAANNPDPHISREQAREEASRFGMIALLQASSGGSSAPTADWARENAEGRDANNALGGMWGATLEDSFGNGGLGVSGIGIGGGGNGENIGIGGVGTMMGGTGRCKAGAKCDGIGSGIGPHGGEHHVTTPQVRVSTPTVNGRIPAEVIQRIVRQNFGRFKMCYENGLRGNPSLSGRVTARFVIDRSGRVASASNGGSDIPDSAVVSCVVGAFAGLSFPEPEGGIVTVNYPISFSPGN
jgi:hypothetical protein